MPLILAISVHTAHRLQEVGILLATLGGVALIAVGVMGQRRIKGLTPESPMPERTMTIIAGALLTIGLLIELVGVHR